MRRIPSLTTVARRTRQLPIVIETLLTYARTRRRMAHEEDVRKLLAAARSSRVRRFRGACAADVRDLARAASVTLARLPNDSRCMLRSLILVELLARRGVTATFVIGTSAVADFRAHAWVEVCGEALLPPGSFAEGRLAEL